MVIKLPDEILVLVLENLDFRTLLICTEVCKNFHDLVNATASLQYIIELAVSGQKDGLHIPGTSSVTKLERLKKHQDAWKNLKWSREIRIPMLGGGLWELFGGVLGQTTKEGGLNFFQLPSDLRGVEEKRWSLEPPFGFRLRDFTMDAGQNLLVLIESPAGSSQRDHRFHLRCLSSGKPHPLAVHATLTLRHTERDDDFSYSMQITGDLAGVYICSRTGGDHDVALWNWKTGELQVNIYAEYIHSFAVLSDRWIVLACFDEHGRQAALWVVDFVAEPGDRRYLTDNKSGRYFEYPELDDDLWIYDMQIRADPGPINEPKTTAYFFQDAKEFVLTVTMTLNSGSGGRDASKYLIQFMSSSQLLSDLRPDVDDNDIVNERGLQSDRLSVVSGHRQISSVWVCYVYGRRFVRAEKTVGDIGGFSARLYDFNQLALRRDAFRAGAEAPGRIETKENIIADIFEDDNETSLSYRHNLLTLIDAHGHCNVMCHEDSIVLVDTECRYYRVLVF